jgi:hypothetical protein
LLFFDALLSLPQWTLPLLYTAFDLLSAFFLYRIATVTYVPPTPAEKRGEDGFEGKGRGCEGWVAAYWWLWSPLVIATCLSNAASTLFGTFIFAAIYCASTGTLLGFQCIPGYCMIS